MTYEQLINKITNNLELSNSEIREYLGEEVINGLIELYKFCDEYDLNIFTHGGHGDDKNVQSMFEQGYILTESYISRSEFEEETGINNYESRLNEFNFYQDDGEKRYSITLKPKNNSIFDDMGQHFLRGKLGLKDLVNRIVIGRGKQPCNLMYFIITPNNKRHSSEIMGEKFSVLYDEDGEVNFGRQDTIASENIALCIDIKNKKIHYNRKYNPKYLVAEKDRFMSLTVNEISDDFMSSIRKNRLILL